MAETKYVLRRLRGIAEIEERLRKIAEHGDRRWAPDAEGLDEEVDRLSQRFFGITRADVIDDWERDFFYAHQKKAHRNKWKLVHRPFIEAGGKGEIAEIKHWASRGWDVTDGSGRMLMSVREFEHQMAAATCRLLGRLPNAERPADEIEAEANEWAKKLLGKDRGRQR